MADLQKKGQDNEKHGLTEEERLQSVDAHLDPDFSAYVQDRYKPSKEITS